MANRPDGLPLHVRVEDFVVRNDELVVSGRLLTDIVGIAGRTPVYVYSRELIDGRIRRLRAALPAEIHLHFAMKANPMPAVVQHISSRVDGLDVASAGELRVALAAGADPDRVSFAGPGKTIEDLTTAVAAAVTVNVESETELNRLVTIGSARGVRPRVAIRVNPDFELKSSGMKMAGGPKQFGIDAELVPDLLRRMKALDLDFQGFHVFSGSQNLRAEAIIEAQTKTVALVTALSRDAPCPPRFVNIGGGFGIPYFPGEQPLDVAPIGAHLHELVGIAARDIPGATLVVELGRYLVGEAGVYVARVIDRKISRGRVFLVTDGGLHQHLAASGNFGQVLRKNYPVLIGNRVADGPRETATVVGPLCTPLDLLADNMELSRAEIGDLVVVFQSGAYGLSASPVSFLSHPPPAELLL
ncbi:MAG: pyridoxal-dependent decarboxylase, exosortase A system-associated [Gammaproteobacteria bacterium]|nr:pyridoxal-dependent decarboxylase, exosortase A system-associated [Gammaproteobacteria bacterium]